MTARRRRLALIAAAGPARVALAAYLTSAGFEVHEYDELTVPGSFAAVVVVHAPERAREPLVDELRAWLALFRRPRLVVVTSTPTALKDLVAAHGERLSVLAAPVFGWDLVDALRAIPPIRPTRPGRA
jgi:hypothetical protein